MKSKNPTLLTMVFGACLILAFACTNISNNKALGDSGIFKGEVGLLEGNCMPGPNSEPCKPKPVRAMIYITSPAKDFDRSKLIDSVASNARGRFQIALKPGEYSAFTKYQSEVSCGVIRCTPDCVCNPFVIAIDSVSSLMLKVDRATY